MKTGPMFESIKSSAQVLQSPVYVGHSRLAVQEARLYGW